MNPSNIKEAVISLDKRMVRAEALFEPWVEHGDDWSDPSWAVERCFLQLLGIIESFKLEELRKMAYTEYLEVKKSKDGFTSFVYDPNDYICSTVLGTVRKYLDVIQSFLSVESNEMVTKDLVQMIRNMAYIITDPGLFRSSPSCEDDVHVRIEGVLKSVFTDLRRKPTLTKQIKNFEPDTGIPSIETLIEYKFLNRKEDVPIIADQLLADTRGYVSNDWKKFLYVIYETHRFKPEKEWKQLFHQSKVPDNMDIIVLSGEPAKSRKRTGKSRGRGRS